MDLYVFFDRFIPLTSTQKGSVADLVMLPEVTQECLVANLTTRLQGNDIYVT